MELVVRMVEIRVGGAQLREMALMIVMRCSSVRTCEEVKVRERKGEVLLLKQ